MTTTRSDAWTGRAGIGLGVALAALAFTGWKIPAGEKPGGLRTSVTVAPTGELDVSPEGRIAAADDVRPGGNAGGSFVVHNQTGSTLAVSLRTTTPDRDLDSLLRVDAAVGGATVIDARLAEARRWHGAVQVPSGARRNVRVRVSVPRDATAYEYRAADLKLELHGTPVR